MKMTNPGHSSIQFDQNIFGSDQLGRFIFWLFFLKSTSLNDNSLNKNYFVMSIIYLKGHLWMSIITFIKRRHPFTSLNYWKRRVGGFPLYPARLGFTLSTCLGGVVCLWKLWPKDFTIGKWCSLTWLVVGAQTSMGHSCLRTSLTIPSSLDTR